MGSGWILISPLHVLYLCFETGENPNPVKAENTHQNEFGFDGYPRIWVLLSCLLHILFCWFCTMVQIHYKWPPLWHAKTNSSSERHIY